MLTWQLVVMFLSLGIAVAALVIVVVINHRSARDIIANELQLENRIEVLESEVSAMMEGAFGVANSLQKLEANFKDEVQRQEQLQQRDMGNLPYNDAVRLASKGASVDELVEHCSLSRSEAELVAMLHKKSTAVDSNATGPLYQQTTTGQTQEPAGGELNAIATDTEKQMAEQFQIDTLMKANDATAEKLSQLEASDTGSDDSDIDEALSFNEVLARSQEFQKQQQSLNVTSNTDKNDDRPQGFGKRY